MKNWEKALRFALQYAILAHMLFHLVSRTIWLIAIP